MRYVHFNDADMRAGMEKARGRLTTGRKAESAEPMNVAKSSASGGER
jgi:hypothetical protein